MKPVETQASIPNLFWLQMLAHAPGLARSAGVLTLRRRIGSTLTLDPARSQGRRVLILGLARTLESDLAGIDILRFDLFVRFNSGLGTPVPSLGADRSRCDVVFHSLTADARPVSAKALSDADTRIPVQRCATNGGFLQVKQAANRLGPGVEVTHLPPENFRRIGTQPGGASPTTGLMALLFFFRAPVAELAITPASPCFRRPAWRNTMMRWPPMRSRFSGSSPRGIMRPTARRRLLPMRCVMRAPRARLSFRDGM